MAFNLPILHLEGLLNLQEGHVNLKTITCKFFLSAPGLESSPDPKSLSSPKLSLNILFCHHSLKAHPFQNGDVVILKGPADICKMNWILCSAGWSALLLQAFYSPYKRFSTQTSLPHPLQNLPRLFQQVQPPPCTRSDLR